jgi:hypothetical protein
MDSSRQENIIVATFTLKDTDQLEANFLYKYRDSYKENAFKNVSSRFEPAVTKNFYFDRPLYGRVDSKNNAIFLSETFLKEITPRINTLVLTHDFIRDAFFDMNNYFARGLATNRLKRTGPLSELIPRRAFSSFHNGYAQYLLKFSSDFTAYVADRKIKKNILNFDSFVNEFLSYMRSTKDLQVLTRSKYIETTLCDPFISGLSISLGAGDFNDDYAKYQNYVIDNNFPFFLETCRRHSFIVDKNAPWVIHFDLSSPAAPKYLNKYNLNNKDEVLDKRYYKAYVTDIKILRDFFKFAYDNLFAADNKVNFVDGINKCNSPIIKVVSREEVTDLHLDQKYPDLFWLKLYFNIKIIEENLQVSKAQYDIIASEMQQILKYGIPSATDQENFYEALDYLNNFVLEHKQTIDFKKIKEY